MFRRKSQQQKYPKWCDDEDSMGPPGMIVIDDSIGVGQYIFMKSEFTPILTFSSNFHPAVFFDISRPAVQQRLEECGARSHYREIFPDAEAISPKRYKYTLSDCPQQPWQEAVEQVTMWLDRGGDINQLSLRYRGFPAALLTLAAIHHQVEMAQFLLSRGAFVDIRDGINFTPLMHTTGLDIARILVAHGADVSAKSTSGCTPLFSCDAPTARFLIEKGADVNARDDSGSTCLTHVNNYFFDKLRVLVENGADVNVQNYLGITPLMLQVETRHLKAIEILITHGARVDLKNAKGLTVLDQWDTALQAYYEQRKMKKHHHPVAYWLDRTLWRGELGPEMRRISELLESAR